jgi:hypothetical protein
MQSSRVDADALRERLDADFYAESYRRNEMALEASGLPLPRIDKITVKCNCGATPKNVAYSGTGTCLIRGADIRPDTLHTHQVLRTERISVARSSNLAAIAGDLVYTMSGASLGEAAVVPPTDEVFSFTNTVVRARFKPEIDAHFISAFLNCRFGRINSARHSTGGDRGHVMPNVFRQLRVPAPDERVQHYIGSKVRQGDLLRESARSIVDQIDARFSEFAIPLPTGNRHARVSEMGLRDRLDPGHYPEAVTRAFQVVGHERVARLNRLATVFSGSTLASGVGALQATVANLDGVFLKGEFRRVVPPRGDGRPMLTHDLGLAAAAHSASYIGKDITYIASPGPVHPSTELLVIRPNRERISSAWLWEFLRSPLGYQQIQACVRGITAHAYPDDLEAILVLLPTEDVNVEFSQYDSDLVRGARMVAAGRALVCGARLLIEALIERRIGEADLVDAGRGHEADRSLLSRLTTNGLDAEGDRLFPDLDELAALISGASESNGVANAP